VRENENSLRKWYGGTAQLRILEGILIVTHFNYMLLSFLSAHN